MGPLGRGRRRWFACLAATAACGGALVLPTVAAAGPTDAYVSNDGTTLHVVADDGTASNMFIHSLTNPTLYIDVDDFANGMSPGNGCQALVPNGARCNRGTITTISVLTYDMNDSITVYPASISNAANVSYAINSGEGDDTVNMRQYADTEGSPSAADINGQGGTDTIYGSDVADDLIGGEGPDTVRAYGGADLLGGHAGRDLLAAGKGFDELYGDGGIDFLKAKDGEQDNAIECGAGKNRRERATVDNVDPKPFSC